MDTNRIFLENLKPIKMFFFSKACHGHLPTRVQPAAAERSRRRSSRSPERRRHSRIRGIGIQPRRRSRPRQQRRQRRQQRSARQAELAGRKWTKWAQFAVGLWTRFSNRYFITFFVIFIDFNLIVCLNKIWKLESINVKNINIITSDFMRLLIFIFYVCFLILILNNM